MRRLASACLLLWFVSGAIVAGDYDFAKERSRVYSYLATEHAECGKEYAKAGLFLDARYQFERARLLVPDHPEAMKGLGYKKDKGVWVFDRGLPESDSVVDARKRVEARKGPDKKRLAFVEKACERLRELAKNAGAAGQTDNATLSWSDLLYYAPKDSEANAKLGRGKDEFGNFLGQGLIRMRADAIKLVKDASEGEQDGEDEQGDMVGAKIYRRKGGPIVARSSESDKRAAGLHKAVSAAATMVNNVLGTEDPQVTEKRPFTVTSCNKREVYEAMVKNFSGREGADLARVLTLKGTYTKKPWGYVSLETTPEGTNDMLSNQTVTTLLEKHRGAYSDPWINTGFAYFVTGTLFGTTRTVRYAAEKKPEVTSARSSDDSPDRDVADGRTPQGLRAYVTRTLRENRPITLYMLAATELNDLSVEHAATAFSYFEFFSEKYPESTRRWLKEKAVKQQAELLTIEKVFGKTIKELQDEWRLWALSNY